MYIYTHFFFARDHLHLKDERDAEEDKKEDFQGQAHVVECCCIRHVLHALCTCKDTYKDTHIRTHMRTHIRIHRRPGARSRVLLHTKKYSTHCAHVRTHVRPHIRTHRRPGARSRVSVCVRSCEHARARGTNMRLQTTGKQNKINENKTRHVCKNKTKQNSRLKENKRKNAI